MDVQSLKWNGLTYIVNKKEESFWKWKQETKRVAVLDDVSGFIEAGTLTAVIGPSGAGKTTFMAAVSRRIEGELLGNIYLNECEVTSSQMKSHSAYVPQHDVSLTSLTPMEHMQFYARLKIKNDCISREEKILQILTSLGLLSCANVPIICLSGGQRRKLMLAGELLTDPQILFCDEPTTGLDSFSACSVVSALRNLSGVEDERAEKRAILCSIHQPSSDLFQQFTHVIIMQTGKIVFQGTLLEAETSFSKIGLICPEHFNPAEFYINAVSLPMNNKKLHRLRNDYDSAYLIGDEETPKLVSSEATSEQCKSIGYSVNWFLQVLLLMMRNLKVTYRNLFHHVIQSIIYLSTAVLLGLLYNGVVPNQNSSIQDTSGAFFTVATEIIFANIYFVVYLIPSEIALLRRETGEGLYSLSAFYIAVIMLMIPKVFIETLLFLFIFYAFTTSSFLWTATVFWQILLSLTIGGISSMSYGFLLSGLFQSIKMTLELAPPLDLTLLMLSGIYINIRSFPYGRYISFFYYTNEAITVSYWNGVETINCPKQLDFPCFKNGTEVLDSLGFGSSQAIIYIDLLGLVCLSTICHVFGYLGVKRLVTKQGFY